MRVVNSTKRKKYGVKRLQIRTQIIRTQIMSFERSAAIITVPPFSVVCTVNNSGEDLKKFAIFDFMLTIASLALSLNPCFLFIKSLTLHHSILLPRPMCLITSSHSTATISTARMPCMCRWTTNLYHQVFPFLIRATALFKHKSTHA